MKIGCNKCERIVDERAAVEWVEVSRYGSASLGGPASRLEGVYCSPGCLKAALGSAEP
jgi:hypothetical protein